MQDDFDNIFFTKEERRIIKRLIKQHKVPEKELDGKHLFNLLRLRFVKYNYLNELSSEGSKVPDGTVSLTDTYYRYKLFKRRRIFEKKLPIIISIIALLKSFDSEIISLVQWLMQLMK